MCQYFGYLTSGQLVSREVVQLHIAGKAAIKLAELAQKQAIATPKQASEQTNAKQDEPTVRVSAEYKHNHGPAGHKRG